LSDGSTLSAWISPAPGALLVALIDSGERPQPFSTCPSQALWSGDPEYWAALGRALCRLQTHFLLLGTSEVESLDAMRARCLSVAGFPTTTLDALAPSSNLFFDPIAAQMNAAADALATREDLCDALGSGAPAAWDALATRWYQQLEPLR
jgi:hypothetical protein